LSDLLFSERPSLYESTCANAYPMVRLPSALLPRVSSQVEVRRVLLPRVISPLTFQRSLLLKARSREVIRRTLLQSVKLAFHKYRAEWKAVWKAVELSLFPRVIFCSLKDPHSTSLRVRTLIRVIFCSLRDPHSTSANADPMVRLPSARLQQVSSQVEVRRVLLPRVISPLAFHRTLLLIV
jgi:hypothetical protein